ncbi:MAG: hypothetical protein WC777_01020 [Candidatus Gracilibacteria bacterium]|jgi:hypothetical protein
MKKFIKPILLLALVVVGFSLLPEHAQATNAMDASEVQRTVEQSIASMVSIGMNFINMLLWPFLLIIGDLMDTDLILGPGMEDRLKGIWIPVRDLVNIAFVLVLLAVAVYNVLGIGGGEGDLALKTALPKIVLGLVLVNFTFIAGKVVLDLTNVATTAVFALPELAASDETPYDFSAVKDEFERSVCWKAVDETTGAPTDYWNAAIDIGDVPIHTQLFCAVDDETGDYIGLDGVLEAKYFQNLNSNNIGLVMAVNMGGLSSLSLLKPEGITDFSDLTISIMFSIVMYAVFAVSYLVLGIVLLTRLVVLWVALALSPLAVLVYVVPQIKEWAGGGGDFVGKVTKHLIAPIIIGATMSLGYIMIAAWDGLTGNAALDGGGFKVDEVISTEFLISGINDLPQLIIALASIVIVWTGVFAAANETYAQGIVSGIESFGGQVKDFLIKLPTVLPTVPISVAGEDAETKVSAGAIKMGLSNAMNLVNNDILLTNQLNNLPQDATFFGIPMNPLGRVENTNPAASYNTARAIITSGQDIDYTQTHDLLSQLRNIVRSSKDNNAKTRMDRGLQNLQSNLTSGDARTLAGFNLTQIRDLLQNSGFTAEQLGFENKPAMDAILNRLDGSTVGLNRTNAPGQQSQAGAAQGAAAIPAVVNLIVPTTASLSTEVAALVAALPGNAAVTTLNGNVTAARNATTTLQTNQDNQSLTTARNAVNTAVTNAIDLRRDPAVAANAALLARVNTAVTQLEEMQRQLNAIRL